MDSSAKANFEREWKRLKEDMFEIRLRLSNIHNDPSVLSDTISLLGEMGEQAQVLESNLSRLNRYKPRPDMETM